MSAAVCVASLASCSSNDEPANNTDNGGNAVKIDASISAKDLFSRSNPAASDERQGSFNEGDAISLMQKEGDKFSMAVKYTLTGGIWTAAGEMVFDHFPTTFRATYPGDASYDKFVLPSDQTTAAGIASADYMRKEVSLDAEPAESKLSLIMERQMARIVVELTHIDPDCGGISTLTVTSPYNGYPAENGVATPVKAYNNDGVYYALVIPGSGSADEDFLVLTTGNGRTLKVKGVPETAAGYSYSFKAAVDAEHVMIIGEPTITPWTDGGVIDGNIETVTYFAGGNGTVASPYLIADATQLDNMHKVILNEDGATGDFYFRLTADIDMSGITGWTPLNTTGNHIFFDGDGHTLSNFSCDKTANPSFFGILLGKVSKVRFVNAVIEDNETGISGILCSYLGNSSGYSSMVEEVYVNGAIAVNAPGWGSDNIDPHGAIAGRVYFSTIRNCYADVTITRPESWGNCGIGGIAGDIVQGATVEYCYATGEIEATGSANSGAIVGRGLDWNECKTNHYRVDNNIGWMTRIHGNSASGRVAGRMLLFRNCDKDAGEYNGTFGTNYGWTGTDMCGSDYTEAEHPDDGARAALDADNIIETAKALGWDETVWSLSGEMPKFVWE